MTRLTILQIVRGLDIGNDSGGAERFGVELSRALNRDGQNVLLCAFFRVGTVTEREWQMKLQAEGIDAFFLVDYRGTNNLWQYLRGLWALFGKLRGINVDVAHSHFQLGSLTAIILKLLRKTSIALRTAHIQREWDNGWVLLHVFIERVFPWVLDAEVGVSQAIVHTLSAHPGSRQTGRPPVLIHNAVSFEQKADLAAAPERLKHHPGELAVISVGRLTEQKGYEYLLKAIPAVIARIPQASFYFVGDGDLRESLMDLSNELKVDPFVTFMGIRSDVPYLLSQSDLFVLSSLWEGFPTVVMESMVCETAVIATDIPGTRELVVHGKNGWLVPPRDPASLSEAIVAALANSEARKTVVGQAKQDVQQFFIDNICQEYLRLYSKIMIRRKGQ